VFLAELGNLATTATSNQCPDGTTGVYEEKAMRENKQRRSHVTPSERKLWQWRIDALASK
jgi:hypothetical protein